MKRFGFTLMEINLAILVMAVGTLGLVSLYAHGYRENQQSNEDVQGAVVAQSLMNAMIGALSSTNMTWSAWNQLGYLQPSAGWGTYVNDTSGFNIEVDENDSNSGSMKAMTKDQANSTASAIFGKILSASGTDGSFADINNQNLAVGIVLSRSASSPARFSIACRCARRAGTLISQPIYYSEVYFQGLKDEEGGGK